MKLTHDVDLYDARSALDENLRTHLTRANPILANLNTALIGICNGIDRLQRDVDLLHSKVQPILKTIADDQAEWQDKVRR